MNVSESEECSSRTHEIQLMQYRVDCMQSEMANRCRLGRHIGIRVLASVLCFLLLVPHASACALCHGFLCFTLTQGVSPMIPNSV